MTKQEWRLGRNTPLFREVISPDGSCFLLAGNETAYNQKPVRRNKMLKKIATTIICCLCLLALPTILFAGLGIYHHKRIADVSMVTCATVLAQIADMQREKASMQLERIELDAERAALPMCQVKKGK